MLAPIIHRLFPASAQNRFRAVVAVRIAPVEGPLVVPLPYILSQRRCSPSGHLVTRRVEHIVGFHFHWLFCPDPVPNRGRAVDAVSVEGRGRSISRAATQYFLNPTSAFSGRRTLCDVRSNALFDALFHFLTAKADPPRSNTARAFGTSILAISYPSEGLLGGCHSMLLYRAWAPGSALFT